MMIGYARVSTDQQSLGAQQDALKSAGCEVIYEEKISGAKDDRPELARMLADIKPGDALVVTSLDRLARSMRSLSNTIETLDERGATFKSLKESWADTTTDHGQLMINILGSLAQFERSIIKSRTSEGRTRAIARGVKMGRKSKFNDFQRKEIAERIKRGESFSSIARSYGVQHTTIMRMK